MKPVENFKDVTISGRTFRIKKFDARTGSFMLFKVTKLIAPIFKSLDIEKLKNLNPSEANLGKVSELLDLSKITESLGSLSEEDFNYVQDKCLRVCYEPLQSGLTPVLHANGSFGVIGLEEDTMTVLALTAHALIFNLKGFFSGSPSASLGGILNTSRQGS